MLSPRLGHVALVVVASACGSVACSSHGHDSAASDTGTEGSTGSGALDADGEGSSSSGSSGGSDSEGGVTDTPACTSDGGFPRPAAVPAFGTFSGPELGGAICAGGAFAYIERTAGPPSQLFLVIDSTGESANFLRFTTPSNAIGGDLTIFASVSAATPGTYPSSGSCGGVAFCVYLPTPSVDCGDAAAPTSCPTGCDLDGPASGPTCVPTEPEDCYIANGTSDCSYGTPGAGGSWNLTLTSVVPYDGEDGGPNGDYAVHGTFTTTMIAEAPGEGMANMTLSF